MKFFKKSTGPKIPGELIKDYGVVNEYRKGIVRFKHNVLLIEKQGRMKIVISENTTLIGVDVRYFEFDAEGARRLKEALDSALKKM